jgi:hypothetical protein
LEAVLWHFKTLSPSRGETETAKNTIKRTKGKTPKEKNTPIPHPIFFGRHF